MSWSRWTLHAAASGHADASYDIWDLGEFDQKGAVRNNWGTKEELVSAIKKAADLGIISYIDAVMNHKCVPWSPQSRGSR